MWVHILPRHLDSRIYVYVSNVHVYHSPETLSLKNYPHPILLSKWMPAMILTWAPTVILHWLSQQWVMCLMGPIIYLLSLRYMHTLLLGSVMLGCESENHVSQAPLPVGFLPVGGTEGNQVAGGERMLCLFSSVPLSPFFQQWSGVAVPPLLSVPPPPPFYIPRHKGDHCFLKVINLWFTSPSNLFPVLNLLSEIPSVVWLSWLMQKSPPNW